MDISSLMPCGELLIALSIAFSGQIPSVRNKIGDIANVNSEAVLCLLEKGLVFNCFSS